MIFQIGDKVSVLDDDITGVVVKVKSDIIAIETSEGFVLDFNSKELILNKSLSNDIFLKTGLKEVIKQKELPLKKHNAKKISKVRQQPVMEVDLHIHKLTDSEKHMTSFDKLSFQLDTAKRQLEFAMRKRIHRIVFIHGVGEGVLKIELETLFRRYDNVKYYDADLQKYGYGATEVYIFQNINP